MIIRIEGSLHTRHACFTCGMYERPGNPDTFAYEGDEKLGWICFDCQELSPQALREKLLEKADYYRNYAAELRRLADGPIQVPTPHELDAMKRLDLLNGTECVLENESYALPTSYEEDLPF